MAKFGFTWNQQQFWQRGFDNCTSAQEPWARASQQEASAHWADQKLYRTDSIFGSPITPPTVPVDFDALETIPEYLARRREEIVRENREEMIRKLADKQAWFRREAIKQWQDWHDGIRLLRDDVRHSKPVCAICDKPVDYIICKASSLSVADYWFNKASASTKYTVYCHGEQQSVSFTLGDIKDWLGFGIGKAFDYQK